MVSEYPVEKRSLPVVRDWPLIEYNPNLCITCLRCVKVCHEVIGASALALKDVGYEARIDTADGGKLNCDFCGECVEACPSGAMATKVSKRWARSWQLRKTSTICPLCSAGCRMEMNVKDNSIFRITTDIDSHNKGSLCVGGRFAYDLIEHEDRLLTPLLRDGEELKPASWEDAIAFAAGKLKKIIDTSGPESVAGLISPRLTNEDCYAFQKFLRGVVGTNNIDSEARFSFLRVQRALELTCGVHGANGTLEELLESSALLVIGIDPLEETPALAWKIKAAARRYDSNVIVANSRRTSLDRFARIRLPIRPYAESDLLLGIMKIILDLELWDTKFVRDQTTNFLSLKKLLDKISLKGILRRNRSCPRSVGGNGPNFRGSVERSHYFWRRCYPSGRWPAMHYEHREPGAANWQYWICQNRNLSDIREREHCWALRYGDYAGIPPWISGYGQSERSFSPRVGHRPPLRSWQNSDRDGSGPRDGRSESTIYCRRGPFDGLSSFRPVCVGF